MFLGSRKKFAEHFGHRLSAQWRSCGYLERCNSILLPNYKLHPDYLKLVEEYDEENAEYIWQTMNPPSETDEDIYIKMEGYEFSGNFESFTAQKAEQGRTVEVLDGNDEWFKRLVNGPWCKEDFLEILPDNEIVPIYDMDEVYRADAKQAPPLPFERGYMKDKMRIADDFNAPLEDFKEYMEL